MAKNIRWMKWVLEESADTAATMPWTRSNRRTPWKTRLAVEAPELNNTELKSA